MSHANGRRAGGRLAALASALVVLAGCKTESGKPPPAGELAPVGAVVQAPVVPARGKAIEPSATRPVDFVASPQVEVYGNYHTAGIVVGLPEGMAADAVVQMRAWLNVDGLWKAVQDPVQVGRFPWYASSLFWLKPASTYQVKVEVIGRGDQTLATWYGEGTTREEPVLHEGTRSLYVSLSGDDSHPGTIAQPFRTVAHAFATVRPGESIVIRGGTYYEGDLVMSGKARPTEPIVIQAYPGERVILNGANPDALDPAAWTREADGTLSYPCAADYVTACVEDLTTGRMIRLFAVRTREEFTTRRLANCNPDISLSGAFDQNGIEGATYLDGARVHVALPAGLTKYRLLLGAHNRGIELDRWRHVQISGIEFSHYGMGLPNTGIMLRHASDILIENCRFAYDDCQIYLKGESDRVTIQNCEFIDAILDWPFGYMKICGAGAPFEGGAVNVDANYSGRGLVFRRNHISGIFDGVHLTPWLHDEARTQETDFYENTVEGCIDDFMELDGFARNVRVFDNYMNRSLSGISLAQALDGPTYLIYNVLANCGMVTAATREGNYGYPFKTNGGPDVEAGTGRVYFYHNTAYTEDPESRAMLVKVAKWRNLTFRNNIWCGQKLGAEFWRPDISPMDFDFDNLYVANTNAPLVLQQYHTEYHSLASVQRQFGWLQHGLSADPRLSAPGAGNYSLSADSPCIDAGTPVSGINDGRTAGAAPDLGAYEAR
ncbi:MAG: right-handed parallel beta-helix repeat-containing protein [Lentisphaerae bacterium]|nr:right-handed parallel beta-helix repeat-containing protein [Lentisphaerota bacterium]